MNNPIVVNRPVVVTSIKFGRNTKAYPQRIELDGNSYNFVDSGLHTTIRRGNSLAEVVSMTDGESNFHMRHEGGTNIWTLLRITQ